jgi:predicted Zn-ribbon and HTH transcriptional regulator
MSKKQRKMTGQELTDAVVNLGSALNNLAGAMSSDMGQIMGVLSGLLNHMDLIEPFRCGSCGSDLSYPKLEGIDPPTACPHCGSDLSEDVPREEE